MDKLERYRAVIERFDNLNDRLGRPEVISDQKLYRKLARERSELVEAADAIRKYLEIARRFDEDKEVAESSDDPELVELARAELDEFGREMDEIDERIQVLLLPRDPDDSRNTVFEIRAGTGGDEA
ncbi:MAG: PCRF domain-containing protein, partial [Candidatus Krumholzibacteria bacterium]|nr:PCRF domain-containing protein [Candidatus Krumholzibacteria bacterium]